MFPIPLLQGLLTTAFHYVSRSLFKSDRLTFGMHLVKGLRGNLFGENEWEAFTGLYDAGDPTTGGGSVPAWVAETNRPSVKKLKANFPKVWEALQLDDESVWKGRVYF